MHVKGNCKFGRHFVTESQEHVGSWQICLIA